MVILATSSGRAPAAPRARPTLANAWRAWTARSPGPTRSPRPSSATCPATKTNRLPVATTTWVYVSAVARSAGLMRSSGTGLRSLTPPHPVLIAYAMNGEPLGLDHGAPFRLIVPHWYAVASVKWLKRIDVLTEPYSGEFQTGHYMYEW